MFSFILTIAIINVAASTQSHPAVEYIEKTPYYVSIRDWKDDHICGGAIIKSNIILASGACSQVIATHIAVDSQKLKISDLKKHVGNYGQSYLNIYFLDGNLQFNENVYPIAIDIQDPPQGTSTLLTGFTDIGGEHALRSTKVEILNYDECKSLHDPKIYNKVFCAFANRMVDMCYAYEGTSLLTCNGKLCSVALWPVNFNCIKNEQESDKVVAGFVQLSKCEEFLRTSGVL